MDTPICLCLKNGVYPQSYFNGESYGNPIYLGVQYFQTNPYLPSKMVI